MTRSRRPSSAQLAEAREAIQRPKDWVLRGEIPWLQAGNLMPGYTARCPLAYASSPEVQVEGLFVDVYYKDSTVPGCPPKLSVVLMFGGQRVLAIDDNGPSRHYNHVGDGLPFFKQVVDHPHRHIIVPDAFQGYAEPLPQMGTISLWECFMGEARIKQFPRFRFPPGQMGMSL